VSIRGFNPALGFKEANGNLRPVLRRCPALARQIGQEHYPRLVGDHQFWGGFERHRLWRHPTAPENRHLSWSDFYGVAIIGPTKIADPYGPRIANVKGTAVAWG
jgi:hypothetical protein